MERRRAMLLVAVGLLLACGSALGAPRQRQVGMHAQGQLMCKDGLCPFAGGECCGNGFCCPPSLQCDTELGACRPRAQTPSWLEQAFPPAEASATCPDGTGCPSTDTCCQLASGAYGCCPYPSATCCPDKLTCCPSGFKCTDNQCLPSKAELTALAAVVPMPQLSLAPIETAASKAPRVLKRGISESASCADPSLSCPDGRTCCPMSDRYGCCPRPNDVCCGDRKHCCPAGYVCDVEHKRCARAT